MFYLYCYRKKRNFGLIHVREGRMSVVNSVKVAVVVSRSLLHEQCDNFCKTQQENAKRTGAVILYVVFMPFCPLESPLKACTTLLWGPDSRVQCEVVFGPDDLDHSEKFPPHRRHLKKMNYWTRDLWMLVEPVAGAIPLARLRNLPRPQSCCRSGQLLRNSHCPKTVQISGLGTGTRLSYAHFSQTANWETNIQCGLLLWCFWNRRSRSKTLYISSPQGSTFYRLVCLFLHIRNH